MSNLPSFNKMKEFVNNNPDCCVWDLQEYFNQKGEFVCRIDESTGINKYRNFIYSINERFYNHFREFIKQDYIECGNYGGIGFMNDGYISEKYKDVIFVSLQINLGE